MSIVDIEAILDGLVIGVLGQIIGAIADKCLNLFEGTHRILHPNVACQADFVNTQVQGLQSWQALNLPPVSCVAQAASSCLSKAQILI